MGDNRVGKSFAKTPWTKRAPSVCTLALGLIVAFQFGNKLLGFAAMIGTWVVCLGLLHLLGQPMERLLLFRESEDS